MHAGIGLMEYFEFVLTREDYGEAKPSPESYLLALRRLGIAPERGVAVEDSERGLAAARTAGLRCLVIPTDMTRNCSFQGAAAILSGVAALLDILPMLQVQD